MIRINALTASTRVAQSGAIMLALVGAYDWAVERAAGRVSRK